MKILFILPGVINSNEKKYFLPYINKFLGSVVFTPTLNYRILSTLTPDNYKTKFIDEEYERIDFDEKSDLVGISTTTTTAMRAYKIADEFKKRGVKVIIGGWHATALPEEAKEHADSVVIGEAEEIWPQLLKDFKEEKLKPFYEQKRPINFKNNLVPDRKKMQHNLGFIIEKVQATRGCTIGCKYCSITNSFCGRTFRFRPIEDVIEEISSLKQKILYFCDASLTINTNYSKELFKAMIGLNKKFYCNGNIGVLSHDDNLLKLSSDAGCVEWSIGFESISQESLNLIDKKTNKVEEFPLAIKKIHDNGINVKGNFMFGLDGDYPNIFDKTLNAIFDWELNLVDINIFTPFPGTPVFDIFEKQGRILTKDWSKYDIKHVVFQPKHMSPQELLDGTKKVIEEIYSLQNTIKRTINCLKIGFYPFLTTGVENIFRKQYV